MPRVLVGHFSVAEAEYGSERSVMLGRDVAVFKSTLADSRWDYVALGHIHRHQNLNPEGYPAIVYCGSLERIDFGEEGEEKGFCWVELERGGTTWSFKSVAARPFRTVHVDVREKSDPMDFVLAELENLELEQAVVRVVVQMREDQEPDLRDRELEAALISTAYLSIVHEVEVEARTRLGDLAPETLSPLELVERYFQSKDVGEDRITSLLVKAEDLLEGDGRE
jgi:exonuclease SbcD